MFKNLVDILFPECFCQRFSLSDFSEKEPSTYGLLCDHWFEESEHGYHGGHLGYKNATTLGKNRKITVFRVTRLKI